MTLKITDVQTRPRRLVCLKFDDGSSIEVDSETFEQSPYKKGDTVTIEQMAILEETSQYNRAKYRALNVLAYRPHSKYELVQKILKVADMQTAQKVADHMQDLGFVDDNQYAVMLAQDLVERKHYSAWRTENTLCTKGIDRDMAKQVVSQLNIDDTQQALELLMKKYYNRLNTPQKQKRVMGALARAGFNARTAKDAMTQALDKLDIKNDESSFYY